MDPILPHVTEIEQRWRRPLPRAGKGPVVARMM
jgi:hypothetical protein